jgi:DNA-binding CsgD family transcriptional regulator/tetratricopeptide (TPR) repeat protein
MGHVPRTGLALLERTEELVRVESALVRGCEGHGGFVVIEGPAGIGKTALLAVARELAGARGMRVLYSRGAELEREFAFGVVRQLFEPPLAEAATAHRVDLLEGAAGVAAGALALPGAAAQAREIAVGPDPPFAVLHGLYWLIANLAASGPVCLAVDDAHWADSPSLRFLAFQLPRLEGLSATLIVTARPRESGADAGLLATLTTDPSAEIVRLAPLTRAAVGEFVETALGESADPEFVDACLRATRGTPFLMRELVGALRDDTVAPTASSAPVVERIGARTVGRSILLRLDRLPEPAGRLARAVAILERGDLQRAAHLAELDHDDAAAAADLLAAADILEPGRPLTFVHPIVRAGIYSELSTGQRARGHRAAAQMLADEPGANERVAEHLLASEPASDSWAVERLVEAARAAARSGAPESAAVYLRRAMEEPPAAKDRAGLLLELGMAEASAGDPGWAIHLGAALDAATDDSGRVAAAMVLALAMGRAHSSAAAVDVLDRAAAMLEPDSERLAVRLEAAAVGVGMIDVSTAAAIAPRRDAVCRRAATDPAAPPELLAVATFASVLTNEPAAVAADLAAKTLAAGRDALLGRTDRPWYARATWFSQTTVSLLWAEQYRRLRPLLDASIAEARATGDSGRFAVGLAHRAWLALRRGELVEAEADAQTALAAAELPAPTFYRVLNGGILIDALVEQGDLDGAELALAPMDDQCTSGSLTAAVLRYGRGRLRVAQGRTDEGLADLLGVGTLLTRAHVTCPSFLPWRSEAARAHLTLGDVDAARRLADVELELARAFTAARTLGVALRAAGIAHGGRGGEALLREALTTLERADATLERARALVDLGALLRRGNRRKEARELLREGLDVAHRAGARPLAARAETELRATGARPRRIALAGIESLTASERRVAELAGEGLTNREIAQTLFITARTVEGHLTSVFRKLELESREDIPAAISRDGAPST